MRIVSLDIQNFRCIKQAHIAFKSQTVLVGDNNCGKSTVLEAIDLVLGPDRMSRHPVVDEYDFFTGKYLNNDEPIQILSEVVVIDLSEEQLRYFNSHIEWYDTENMSMLSEPPASQTDRDNVVPALRVRFVGNYNKDEDDFEGYTYYANPPAIADGKPDVFSKKDKRMCGFLYLRTLRTGSRALSMEHGSLLDIILSIKELRPQMWEDVIHQINHVAVAAEPEFGLSEVLTSLQDEIHKLLPADTANNPVMKVSDLTRENLRRAITVFLDSGLRREDDTVYAVPYYKMGTGTINVLVLSLLRIIANLKQKVIFAMEEPEIAIPPYIQKSIITNVLSNSHQAIFTSHSPYVLEEFSPDNVIVLSNDMGVLNYEAAKLPPQVKLKAYREDLRRKYFESLLSKRVLITEGRTEYDVYSAAARRLEELDSAKYASFDRMGIALVNAESDSKVAPLGKYYKSLNKTVYAVFDKQDEVASKNIAESVDEAYEAQEHGIENVVLNGISEAALRRYTNEIIADGRWPSDLVGETPTPDVNYSELKGIMFKFFKRKKGEGALADLIAQCKADEFPTFVSDTISDIKSKIDSILLE